MHFSLRRHDAVQEAIEAALVGRSMRSGPETYNNVEDKTETGRDSVGF